MNDLSPTSFSLMSMIFFPSPLSAPSSFFSLFFVLSKRDNHNLKKRENKSENKTKNTLDTGQFHLDKRNAK